MIGSRRGDHDTEVTERIAPTYPEAGDARVAFAYNYKGRRVRKAVALPTLIRIGSALVRRPALQARAKRLELCGSGRFGRAVIQPDGKRASACGPRLTASVRRPMRDC